MEKCGQVNPYTADKQIMKILISTHQTNAFLFNFKMFP